jgi:hypothetical protein
MLLRRLLGHGDLSANDGAFAEKGIVGEQLETIFAGMLEDDAHQVYGDGNCLADILEIDGLALLEDDFVLVIYIDEADFEMGDAVAVGHLAEVYELVVTNGVPGGVDVLDNVYDARHSGYAIEYYPVAYNRGKQNRGYLIHLELIPSAQTRH